VVDGSGASVSSRRDAEEAAVLVGALDHGSIELELADDDGGKVNPTGAQLIERHWLLARVP
jgi:hypothetical protein